MGENGKESEIERGRKKKGERKERKKEVRGKKRGIETKEGE